MNKQSNLWRTLYTDDYSDNCYLYHYTDFSAAIKILSSDRLNFSSISKTTHDAQAKRRIFIPVPKEMDEKDYQKAIIEIERYYSICKPYIRILCFSMDSGIKDDAREKVFKRADPMIKFYDVLGRGFALPRMWEKYFEKNNGVCFILDKRKLLKSISGQARLLLESPVNYKNPFDIYRINEQHLKKLIARITNSTSEEAKLQSIAQNDKEFFSYNFLEKSSDWKGEHEYRIIALAQETNSSIFVNDFSSSLCGIVVSRDLDPDYKKVLFLLMRGANIECDIKQIAFCRNCCKLE